MKAGPLRYRLELQRPEHRANSFGDEGTAYTPTTFANAERVTLNGRRSEEVGEHFADYSVQFRIRDAHTVEENWRVRQLGGYLYQVLAIEPNIGRGFKTLICTRVNP